MIHIPSICNVSVNNKQFLFLFWVFELWLRRRRWTTLIYKVTMTLFLSHVCGSSIWSTCLRMCCWVRSSRTPMNRCKGCELVMWCKWGGGRGFQRPLKMFSANGSIAAIFTLILLSSVALNFSIMTFFLLNVSVKDIPSYHQRGSIKDGRDRLRVCVSVNGICKWTNWSSVSVSYKGINRGRSSE